MNELQDSIESKGKTENRIKESHHELYDCLSAFGIFFVFVVGGAIFYMVAESCTCSYGVSQKANCIPDDCVATDGYTKNFGEAIYMAVITLTTVGFGDFTPKSK